MALKPNDIYEFGPFRLDARERALLRDGNPVNLTAKAFDLLLILVRNYGRLVEKEQLMQELWSGVSVEEGNLTYNVSILRKALGNDAARQQYIETVPRHGYRLVAHMRRIQELQTQRTGLRYKGVAAGLILGAIVLMVYRLARPVPAPRIFHSAQLTHDGRLKWGRVVTDGSRLYFSEKVGGHLTVVQVPVEGGQTTPVPTPFPDVLVLDILANRFPELLVKVAREPEFGAPADPVWILPAAGGAPRRLGDVRANDASFSPDGQRIAYSQGSEVYLAKGDGSEPRKLAVVPGIAARFVWSLDGRRLRFGVGDAKTGLGSIWDASTDGSGLHMMLLKRGDSQLAETGPWTPDGGYFFFVSGRVGTSDIWVIRERVGLLQGPGKQPARLTYGPMAFGDLAVSKDGKKLFAVGFAPPVYELMRYDGRSQQFAPFLPGIPADTPDFSMVGRWLTYVGPPGRTLWRCTVDDRERVQLTTGPMDVDLPRLSPDGKWIAFMGQIPGKPWQIYLVAGEGGSPRQLTASEQGRGAPTWSPDGKALVFADVECSPQTTCAVHRLDLATRDLTKLPGSEGLRTARWSPDGRYVAALRPTEQELVLFDLGTQKWEVLAKPVTGDALNWSHDGKYIYAFTDYDGDPSVVRVRLGARSPRRLERVASLKDLGRMTGEVGMWFGLAPDNSILAARKTETAEIWAMDWEEE